MCQKYMHVPYTSLTTFFAENVWIDVLYQVNLVT